MKLLFPQELTSLNQWVCWRLEQGTKDGKPTKIPYNPANGKKASSTDSNTWSTIENALKANEKFMYSGIGFVFSKNDDIVGVDIDHCIDADTGEMNDIAKRILERKPTYTEISPSGTGLHLFYKGVFNGKGNKNTENGVEMYSSSRYFTMTGNKLADAPFVIADDDGDLEWIHSKYIKPKKVKKSISEVFKSVSLSDEEVLEKALSSENHKEFNLLLEGKWQELYPSQSEADFAFCCSLAFWTGKNKEQMDRIFRQSGLIREKWDIVHHSGGTTYGEETLNKAIESVDNVYNPFKESPIFENKGRYFRTKGEKFYSITNFIINPVEMVISEDETQLTVDIVTVKGEVFRETFMTTDFNNLQRFKNIINRNTICISYTGTENDLELLKSYISQLKWVRKTGVKSAGLYFHIGRWVYVSKEGSIEAGGIEVNDIIQLEKYSSLSSDILSTDLLTLDKLKLVCEHLLGYNEPAKTVPILAWCAGCFIKEHLRNSNNKYPHLLLIGEAGSGKSTTLERIILPTFSRAKVAAATQVTAFTLMRDSASSNLVPQTLDEFKPSKIDKNKLAILYNHMRDSYDGHEGVRGRADQSSVSYQLLAPLVVAGEESPDEPAIRERGIELLFSKKDIKNIEYVNCFKYLIQNESKLGDFGRSLLDTALRTDAKEVNGWFEEQLCFFEKEFPNRIAHNLSCCVAGLRLLQKLLKQNSLSWDDVFHIPFDIFVKHLSFSAKEYLLDGNITNKGIIEQSFEVMSRMGLLYDVEWTRLENGSQLAIRLNLVYDRFTKYRRDYAIAGECLEYRQFLKQLKNSDLFIDNRAVRFKDEVQRAYVIDLTALSNRCDIDGFTTNPLLPLT